MQKEEKTETRYEEGEEQVWRTDGRRIKGWREGQGGSDRRTKREGHEGRRERKGIRGVREKRQG